MILLKLSHLITCLKTWDECHTWTMHKNKMTKKKSSVKMRGYSFCPELSERSVGYNVYREIYRCLWRFWFVRGGDGGRKGVCQSESEHSMLEIRG